RLRSKMASNLLGAFVCDFIQEFSPHLLILFPSLLSVGVIDVVDRNALECSFLKCDEPPNAGLQYRYPYFLELRAGFFTIPARPGWHNREKHTKTTGADILKRIEDEEQRIKTQSIRCDGNDEHITAVSKRVQILLRWPCLGVNNNMLILTGKTCRLAFVNHAKR